MRGVFGVEREARSGKTSHSMHLLCIKLLTYAVHDIDTDRKNVLGSSLHVRMATTIALSRFTFKINIKLMNYSIANTKGSFE